MRNFATGALALIVAGCAIAFLLSSYAAPVRAMEISELKGKWILEAIHDKDLPAQKAEIFFEVSESAISGFDGCNRFGADLNQLSMMRKTQRACATETTLLPLDLSDLAGQLRRAAIRGNKLFVPLSSAEGEARFRRVCD